jgi:hypothetical protein
MLEESLEYLEKRKVSSEFRSCQNQVKLGQLDLEAPQPNEDLVILKLCLDFHFK